jgi:hypothetical protein
MAQGHQGAEQPEAVGAREPPLSPTRTGVRPLVVVALAGHVAEPDERVDRDQPVVALRLRRLRLLERRGSGYPIVADERLVAQRLQLDLPRPQRPRLVERRVGMRGELASGARASSGCGGRRAAHRHPLEVPEPPGSVADLPPCL